MTQGADNRGMRPLGLVLLFLVLLLVWLLWSGIFKPLLLGLGLFSCVLSVWAGVRMGFFRHSSVLVALPRLPAYLAWLLKEIVLSSIQVAKLVLKPELDISPTLVEIDATALSEGQQVILGNSITLSPGTVTLDIHLGRLVVHCITREGADALQTGDTLQRVARLEEP